MRSGSVGLSCGEEEKRELVRRASERDARVGERERERARMRMRARTRTHSNEVMDESGEWPWRKERQQYQAQTTGMPLRTPPDSSPSLHSSSASSGYSLEPALPISTSATYTPQRTRASTTPGQLPSHMHVRGQTNPPEPRHAYTLPLLLSQHAHYHSHENADAGEGEHRNKSEIEQDTYTSSRLLLTPPPTPPYTPRLIPLPASPAYSPHTHAASPSSPSPRHTRTPPPPPHLLLTSAHTHSHSQAGTNINSPTFNARKASTQLRAVQGYVSFAAVEGLGGPPGPDTPVDPAGAGVGAMKGKERRGWARLWW